MLRRFFSYVKEIHVSRKRVDDMFYSVPTLLDMQDTYLFYLKHEHELFPQAIARSVQQMVKRGYILDQWWPKVCGFLKQQMRLYDRDAAIYLWNIANCVGQMGEKNQEFWDIVDQKLDKEDLLRYIPEKGVFELLTTMEKLGTGSEGLKEKMRAYCEKHKVAIQEDFFPRRHEPFNNYAPGHQLP